MKRILTTALALVSLSTASAAPVPPAVREAGARVSAPVVYEDLMLVLVTADGAAAVVFGKVEAEGAEVPYRFRYQSADGKTTKAGEGNLFERRLNGGNGGFDEAGLDIKAGPVTLRWSKGSDKRGWVYHVPEKLAIHIAHARGFEDSVEDFGRQKIEYKALDLTRYMRK